MSTLKVYEKYDASLSAEVTDVNWKTVSDPANEYYFYPVLRPTTTLDQTCSKTKYNYFRIQDAYSVSNAEIILVSPYLTKIKGYVTKLTATTYKVEIDYPGSGFKEELFDYPVSTTPKTAIKVKIVGSSAVLGHAIINLDTGEVDEVILETSPPAMIVGTRYQFESFLGVELDATQPTVSKRVKNTALFYRLSSSFSTPSEDYDFNMMYAGIGNIHITVPLLASPETPYSEINTSYTGIDLYTPYIVTQLRTSMSEWDDVGNSPQYKILLKCKIFN